MARSQRYPSHQSVCPFALTNISAALNASDSQFPNILITIPYIFKCLNRPEMAAITGCRTVRLI